MGFLGMLTAVYMHKTYTLYIQNHCKNISRNDSPLIIIFWLCYYNEIMNDEELHPKMNREIHDATRQKIVHFTKHESRFFSWDVGLLTSCVSSVRQSHKRKNRFSCRVLNTIFSTVYLEKLILSSKFIIISQTVNSHDVANLFSFFSNTYFHF